MEGTQVQSFSMAKARQNFAEVVNHVSYGRLKVVLTRHGRRMAAIVPMSDLRRLRKLDERNETAGLPAKKVMVREMEKELGLT